MGLRLVFSILLGLTALLGVILSLHAARHRRVAGALPFAIFMAACSVYAGCYVGALWGGSLPVILAWIRLEYIGIASLPTTWLFFVAAYTGRRLPRPLLAAMILASTITLLLVNTLPFHRLYYIDPRLDLSGPFPTIAFDRGPWYWIQALYNWIALSTGQLMLFAFLFRAPSVFRGQIGVAVAAATLPLAANALYLAGLIPNHLDPTPATFPIFALPLALGLFRFRFLDLMPIARERVLEALEDGVLVVDMDGRIVDLNPAGKLMLGLDAACLGRHFDEAVSGGFGLGPLAADGAGSVDFCTEPGGVTAPRRYRARAYRVKGGRGRILGVAMILSDVTEEAALLSRLEEMASTDVLTGLFNRRRFFESALREFELARRNTRPLCVCIIDIDHFKLVNDSYGHAAGDEILRETSSRFRSCLRATDLLCRYGGEEFAVLLPESDGASGVEAAERLRRRLAEEAVAFEGGSTTVTVSIGIHAAIPGGEYPTREGLDRFLRLADEALYRAKAEGRNRVVASPEGSEAPRPVVSRGPLAGRFSTKSPQKPP